MLEEIVAFDKELFLFLNGLGSEPWDLIWLTITNKLTFIPLYALLLFLIYKNYGLKTMLVIIVIIAAMITFTDQTTNLVKRSVARFRPCADEEIKDLIRYIAERCSSRRSFFSGHASNSMAAAVFGGLVLRKYYKNIIFLLVIWAFIVAYSRIYVGVHFPIDVICGMLFGALAGYLFYKINKSVLKRFNLLSR